MKTFDRNTVESAVKYVYENVTISFDNEYIKSKTVQFMKRVCLYSNAPNNPWLKSKITEESIRNTAFRMFDMDCYSKLLDLLGIDNEFLEKSNSIVDEVTEYI